ncbi:T-cell immunoreceptor with Ig and ITIM domains-like isoform X2 [Anguilla anguilla]|uniref:T-cell immunoreceptor with Ig and ITIM domains-like isoform X2 n=1 Tax=Anguilla anguilla TaxID=7936 RepID=UPI0015AB3D42|nr:T-cell immunoreceptor with Ig and ITIM domains-like isoform X2 [Anguilla anguilla]
MELMKCFLAFVFSSCMIRTVVESQSVSVDPQVTAYLGGEVTLRCQFIQGGSAAKATQVDWRKESFSEPLAVFHSEFGKNYSKSSGGRVRFTSSSVDDASISIININETDAGKYTCRYATFPEGSKEATTTLTVRVKPWEHSTAVASGIVTALLLIVLIAAALCFIMMKRRQRNLTAVHGFPRCDAAPQSRSSRSSSSSSSRPATRVTGREEENVTYADMRGFRPAQGDSAIRTSREGTEYAEVKRSVEGCREVTYAQVNKR